MYGSRAGPSTTTIENTSPSMTPTNTPSENPNSAPPPSVLLKGIETIPLLASAASEPQKSYMQRLSVTNSSQSWWGRQVPICSVGSSANPGFSAKLEGIIIRVGAFFERQALAGHSLGPLRPTTFHAAVFPIHVLLLTYWINLVFLLTIPTTLYLTVKTILLGSDCTGVTLTQLIESNLSPTSSIASAMMSDTRNSLPPRLTGLALTPLVLITDLTLSVYGMAGDFAASIVYCIGVLTTWWYWAFVIPWFMTAMGWVGVAYSCCCAIVQIAGL